MNKYLKIFEISFQQEFAYRLNFVMWRVRNVMQIFLTFFLWDNIFSDPTRTVFGYDRARILTYVFAVLLVRPLITSSRAIDIGGEISQGNLSNYLLKPVNYFRYWFTRDIASKSLNLIFAVFEFILLVVVLKPPLFIQTNAVFLILFIFSLFLSVVLFFLLMVIFNLFTLWYPEQAWGVTFLLLIFTELLGGGLFPIDILPEIYQRALFLTPFPHLIFSPIQIYLGKVGLLSSLSIIGISLVWIIFLSFALKTIWEKGLSVYRAEGR